MNEPRGPPVNPHNTMRAQAPRRLRALASGLVLAAVLALAQPAQAQDGCSEAGMNKQCTEFGVISMPSQGDIRGEAITLTTSIALNTAYADQGARWLLFSVRNVEEDGSNPVTIELVSFASSYGDIVTTRAERPSANELNLWVDVLDTPVGVPINIDLRVGATERGAFTLETLVMAFDRGYAPIQDASGNDASLFSFTLLGVNEETRGIGHDSGSLLDGNKVPGFGMVPLLGALVVVAALVRRRLA